MRNPSNITSALLAVVALAAFIPSVADAAAPITYRYRHHVFTIDPDFYNWNGSREQWLYNGRPTAALPQWRVDGDVLPALPAGVERSTTTQIDPAAVARTIQEQIGTKLNREPRNVTISRGASGAIAFSGVGMLGRSVDIERAARLTIAAMEQGITDIDLPVSEQQPVVTVEDPELAAAGIKEIVTVGESNFTGSPANRRHNIATGMSKFNGHRIPKGSVFSFNTVLGPVNGSTGYKKELVIMGAKTVPEYGGGLCQISTTAYRGIWEYGFPIEERRNHSFAVQYYAPNGTDATIYPGQTDMRFTNDSPGDLVMQTNIDGDNAYYIYYGTRDDRKSQVIGPYTWGFSAAPADRIEYTTSLPPGVSRKVGSRVPGLRAAWFRTVQPAGATGSTVEGYYSVYQARPLFHEVGVAAADVPAEPVDAGLAAPSWLDID